MKKLTVQTISGFLKLFAALVLFIFLPAGTLRYWQGWIFLFVFLGCAAAITLYFLKHDPKLIESRLQAGPVAEKQREQKIIQALAGFFFASILVISGLDRRFGWSDLSGWADLLGDGFVLLGYGVIFWVFRENTYAASVVTIRSKQKVISTGPYGYVRHPMYAGSFVMLLGIPLALGSLWGIAPASLLCAIVVVRLIEEEKFLSKKLPGYKAYCRKTPYRLIRGLW